ncbi:MAG: glycosyltransferase N-terminal domain-containing protein [Myxococcota bacterium]
MGPLAHSMAAAGAVAATPVLALAALLRPSFRSQLPERLGLATSPGAGRIWLHASSVGEAKAACRLLDALEAGGEATRATTMTVSGRGIFRRDRPTMPATLAPFDHPWCIEAAMRAGRPRLSVLIETELWPSWIASCARHAVPVVVVSGRLSDRSFPRYRRIRRLLAPTLRRLDAVGARTELDAARFAELGVPEDRIRVTGDLKLDPPTSPPALGPDLARALAGRVVVTGGSTHRGEEDPLLAALDAAEREGQSFVLVIAPRDVGRSGEIVRLALARGRRAVLRSRLADATLRAGEVLVLDSYGELAAAYAASSLAFVGGTLVAVGGHNVSEPVHAGCPVLFGPELANVRKIVEILEADGCGRRVPGTEALVAAIAASLRDLEGCRRRGEIGRATLERHRGSVERSRALILDVLARGTRVAPAATERPVRPSPGAETQP